MKRKFLSIIIAACLAITSLTGCNSAKVTPTESETSSVSSAVDTVTVPSIPDGTTIDPSVDVSQQSFYSLFNDLGLKVNLKPISPSSDDDKPNTIAYSKPYEGSEVEKDSVVTVYYFKDTTPSSSSESAPASSSQSAAPQNNKWVDGTAFSGKVTEFDNPNYVWTPSSAVAKANAKYAPIYSVKKVICDSQYDYIEMTYMEKADGNDAKGYSVRDISISGCAPKSVQFGTNGNVIRPNVPITIYLKYSISKFVNFLNDDGTLNEYFSGSVNFADRSGSVSFMLKLQ